MDGGSTDDRLGAVMVRGRLTGAERRYWRRVLGAGFVGVVALSATLIAVQGGASLAETGLVALVGAGVGLLLVRYLAWMDVEHDEGRSRRER